MIGQSGKSQESLHFPASLIRWPRPAPGQAPLPPPLLSEIDFEQPIYLCLLSVTLFRSPRGSSPPVALSTSLAPRNDGNELTEESSIASRRGLNPATALSRRQRQ